MSIEYLKARLKDQSLTKVQRELIEKILADIKKWLN